MAEYGSAASVATPLPVPAESTGLGRVGRRIVLSGAAAGAYYAGARLGYALDFAGPVAAIVWLPVGIGISFLYVGGLGLWPGLVVGDLLANDYAALPVASAMGQTCGNLLELVVAVVLLRRLIPRGSPLDRPAGVARMAAALAAATALSATIGSASLLLGGVIEWSSTPEVWRTWWLGDFSGALLVVPLVLAWQRPRTGSEGRLGGALILVAVAVVTEIVFTSGQPIVYLAFPVLLWSALRIGQRGATLALLVSASVGVWNTTHSTGPFHFRSVTESIVSLQLYMTVASLSTLLLAAVVFEREQIARRLGEAQAQSTRAASVERHRLERDLHGGAQNRLAALSVRVGCATDRPPTTVGKTAALLRQIAEELGSVNNDLRTVTHGLHPLVLTSLGLADAIRSLAARSPVPVELRALPSASLEAPVEEVAYLVVAEAVTNAQKHAGASSISISVRLVRDALEIRVADDGGGGAEERPGWSLSGLRERVETIGGTFLLESAGGQGTRLTATIPVPERHGADAAMLVE